MAYLITTNVNTIRIHATTRREAILAALELHGPGARIVRVEIAPEWE